MYAGGRRRVKLKIARNLALPIDAVTQTFAILAKRGVGKTYAALVLAEELLQADQSVCVIDPIGVCWGLRSSADGRSAGYPIVVMGGDHGDVPLEETAGETIADFLVDERQSCVLDLSLFRKRESVRFMTAFAEQLYRRNRKPLHVIIDEADAFAPQRPGRDQARMLGALEDIVRRGRARGLGVTLVTQRAAVLNKNVLTQIETLCVLRTLSPQDRKAMEEWILAKDQAGRRSEFMESLADLPVGTAWLWSPGWLDVFQKIKIRKRRTFDSSATPDASTGTDEPKKRAEVDLDELRGRIASTIEKAKANNPKELQKRIAALERELRKKDSAPTEPEVIEVEAVSKDDLSRLEAGVTTITKCADDLRGELGALSSTLAEIGRALAKVGRNGHARKLRPPARSAPPSRATKAQRTPAVTGDISLTGPEQRILDAIAWLESLGQEEAEQAAVAFIAGYTVGGGAWNNPRGSLHTKGLIEYRPSKRLALTDEGRALANAPDAPLTADELQARVMSRLPGPERKLLEALIDAYPEPLANEELAERAGYSPGGGAFNNPRGRLRSLGLVDYPERGVVVARPLLFLEE